MPDIVAKPGVLGCRAAVVITAGPTVDSQHAHGRAVGLTPRRRRSVFQRRHLLRQLFCRGTDESGFQDRETAFGHLRPGGPGPSKKHSLL